MLKEFASEQSACVHSAQYQIHGEKGKGVMNLELVDASIWDTLVYPKEGIGRLQFFGKPLSTNKTLYETNMTMENCLPVPKAFMLQSIAVSCMDEEIPFEIFRYAVFDMIVGTKSYFEISPVSAIFKLPDGLLSGHDLKPPLYLMNDQKFLAEMFWPRKVMKVKRAVNIRVQLNGQMQRAIV